MYGNEWSAARQTGGNVSGGGMGLGGKWEL